MSTGDVSIEGGWRHASRRGGGSRRLGGLIALSLATLLAAALATVPAVRPAQATPTWIPEVSDLSSPGQNADYPQVAVAADGTTTVVWQRSDGANLIVQAATRSLGGVWNPPVAVSVPGQDAIYPQVAAAKDGTTTVVWQRFDGVHWIVQATSRSPGGSWSTPAGLSAPGQDATYPQVAAAAVGTTTAVWQRRDGTGWVVQAASRSAAGAWSTPTDLSTSNRYVPDPQVAAAADGTTTAVWAQTTWAYSAVQAATRSSSGTWSATTNLSTDDASYPQVAAANGTTAAVWTRYDGGHMVRAAARDSGGTWSAAVNLTPLSSNGDAARVVAAADGTTTAVWSLFNGFEWVVQTTSRRPGEPWTPTTNLSTTGQHATHAQVAGAPDGTFTVVWQRYRDPWVVDAIQATTRHPQNIWTTPIELTAPGEDPYYPEVAAADDGTFAVWEVSRGTYWSVRARLLDHGGPALDIRIPAKGVVDQSLLLQATALDWSNPTTLTWTLGDGTTGTGPSVTHAYTSVGTYNVAVTATDALGNTTTRTAGTVTITRPVPRITRFKLTRTTISTSHRPRATRAVITLTEPAKVVLTFKKKGTRAQRTAFRLDAGTTRVRLTARLSRIARLTPGTYKVTAVATDKAGASTPRTTRLRVVR
jgi:hypothetical protein